MGQPQAVMADQLKAWPGVYLVNSFIVGAPAFVPNGVVPVMLTMGYTMGEGLTEEDFGDWNKFFSASPDMALHISPLGDMV